MRLLSLGLVALCLLSACSFINHSSFLDQREKDDVAYLQLPPGKKKKRKLLTKAYPSIAFTEALKRYRLERGFFPADLWNLENYDAQARTAMKGMREQGFTSLQISYLYLDSLVIDFVHTPVYHTHVSTIDMSPDVSGKFIFTMKDSSFFSNTIFDKTIN